MTPTHHVDACAVRLAAYAAGDPAKPPLLLLHGYPDNALVWAGCVERLAKHFYVLRYDVRGAGQSTRPSHTAAYALQHLVRDLFTVINALSPRRPVHLVGHDWGSIQSWEAVCAPQAAGRIASFTSISGPSLDHAGYWLQAHRRERNFGRLARQSLKSWYVGAFHLPRVGESVWRLGGPRFWPQALARVEGIRNAAPSATQTQDGIDGIKLYRANVRPRLRAPRKRHTALPVHLIVPTHDHFVDPALYDGLEHWAETLHRSSIDAGHWAPLSHPDALTTMIAGWLDTLDLAGGDGAPARSAVSC